jgi:hypothetical protein
MLVLRLDQARRRSLLVQERANAARERSTQRYLNGRRS